MNENKYFWTVMKSGLNKRKIICVGKIHFYFIYKWNQYKNLNIYMMVSTIANFKLLIVNN
jgi:hypothetical protein